MAADFSPLVSCDWLATHLDEPDLRVLDASWYLPSAARDGKAEFVAARIPGAHFFDIDRIADSASPLPHMLPSAKGFAAWMTALGIAPGDRVVVYDAEGMFSAPRAWWMLRVFGHEMVAVLDGGLAAWRAAGLPLETTPATPLDGDGPAFRQAPGEGPPRSALLYRYEDILAALPERRLTLVDARSRERFAGTAAEPRPGLAAGHVPGSLNLPYRDLLSAEGTRLLSPGMLAARFTAAGVDWKTPVVFTCGSGISACILAFAAHLLGHESAVYDGSWAEWGSMAEAPIATLPESGAGANGTEREHS